MATKSEQLLANHRTKELQHAVIPGVLEVTIARGRWLQQTRTLGEDVVEAREPVRT